MSDPTPAAQPATQPAAENQQPIVFFDGVCGLCNRFVDRLLRADRRRALRFAPLQGETARRRLPPLAAEPERWSVLLLDADGVHAGSDAVARIGRLVGGWLRPLGLLGLVPRLVREPVYRLIARNRYRWFGRRAACRLPAAAERDRFLP